MILGVPGRLSGERSQLALPHLSAFLVLARCTVPWGTDRLQDTLKAPRKNGGPRGLCQGMRGTCTLGKEWREGVRLKEGFRAMHRAGENDQL